VIATGVAVGTPDGVPKVRVAITDVLKEDSPDLALHGAFSTWLHEMLHGTALELTLDSLLEVNSWLDRNARDSVPYGEPELERIFSRIGRPAEKADDVEKPPAPVPQVAEDRFGYAYVPFRSDTPREREDALERGKLAYFLARRLHLIWCEKNGCPQRL